MRPNIVWCGCVVVGWLALTPPLTAGGVPRSTAAPAYAALRTADETAQRRPVVASARPAADDEASRARTRAADEDRRAFVAATDHFLWISPVLTLVGLALAWLLATSGPIV